MPTVPASSVVASSSLASPLPRQLPANVSVRQRKAAWVSAALWRIGVGFQDPGSCLASPGLCSPLGGESGDGRASLLSPSFLSVTAFKINKQHLFTKEMRYKMCEATVKMLSTKPIKWASITGYIYPYGGTSNIHGKRNEKLSSFLCKIVLKSAQSFFTVDTL